MEKTINIDGRQVTFKATGGLPYRYKAQFGREYFADTLKIEAILAQHNAIVPLPENASDREKAMYERRCTLALMELPLDTMYNILWCMAKVADNSIPSPQAWLDSFNVFPVFDIWEEVNEIVDRNLSVDPKNA